MSEEFTATENGVRAIDYSGEQLWNVRYGLIEAYKVDTGKDSNWSVKTWEQLTSEERRVWTMATSPVMPLLMDAAEKAGLA